MLQYQPTIREICAVYIHFVRLYPDDSTRLHRAGGLLDNGALSYVSRAIGWQCKSQQDPETKVYPVALHHCACYNYLNQQFDRAVESGEKLAACKHTYALEMYEWILEQHLNHRLQEELDADWGPGGTPPHLWRIHDFQRPICYARLEDPPADLTRPWRFDDLHDLAQFSDWLAEHPSTAAVGQSPWLVLPLTVKVQSIQPTQKGEATDANR